MKSRRFFLIGGAFLFLCLPLHWAGATVVEWIVIDGAIGPVATQYIRDGIERAQQSNAECLIIELDTPGGLLKSTRLICKDILAAPIPVVVYVSPAGSRAGSAGVFITLAAHIAAMAPGTNIGAAHPVDIGGQGGGDTSRVMEQKITNDAVAFARTLADKRGRNADWAEKAVRESASITETEALELGVINYIAPNTDSLLALMDGDTVELEGRRVVLATRGARIDKVMMNWRLKLLALLSDPNIAYILLLLGIYGIFFELYNPGAILPGIVGGICLIIAFYSLQLLPVNLAGVLLIILALVLFLLEIKVVSYGLLSIGGVISFLLGSLMLFDVSIPGAKVSLSVIIPATIFTALFFLFAVGMGIRAQRRKVTTGMEGLIGEIGTAVSPLAPAGTVLLHGELWKAVARSPVEKDQEVRVVAVNRLQLTVEPL
ncbi:MAG: nodulation protein NfeD [Calditrichaeota bacterium]|nr:nodulation protein NfeD [Calditrichota bacterium]